MGNFTTRPISQQRQRFVQPSEPQFRAESVGRSVRGVKKKMASAWLWVRQLQQRIGWPRFLVRLFLIGMGLGVLYVAFLFLTLPSIDEQSILAASQSTIITDRNGIELYRIHGEEDRTVIPASAIPEQLKEAVIAIEDKRYYDRGCIDVRALLRAIFRFGQAGGASTITRQLARNALDLKRENIVSRKIKEFILGCQLESKYSKPDLLALYLNWIPFGQNAYGIEQASHRYFGVGAKDLTLAQATVLAGLPQLPSYFSPYGRHVHSTVSERLRKDILEKKITKTSQVRDSDVMIGLLGTYVGSGTNAVYVGGRADQVLQNMQDQGFITAEQKQKTVEDLGKLTFKPFRENIRAPHFVLWAKDQAEALLGNSPDQGLLEQGGLTIQTTLDWRLQDIAEQVIAAHKDDAEKRFMAHNIALVAMDPVTKEILAYVGNTDYSDATKEGKIDMAQVPRQPGSSFKPFVYASAFREGYGPGTVLYDVPTKFGDYEPQNFEGSFWGLLSARRALGGSRNIPAVKAYFLGGQEDQILSLAAEMGVTSPKELKPTLGYGAALAIGAAEVPLLQMIQGYSTIADGGVYKPVISVQKVTDKRGALLPLPDAADPTHEGQKVIDPRIAYELTSILSDNSARPPNEYWRTILTIPGIQVAAKTGTSNKCLERDDKQNCKKRKPDNLWTLGYSPVLATGVWVGNATNDPLSDKADGLTVAAPIWHDFMIKAHKILKPTVTTFTQPDGIVQAQISLLSGELPTECTPIGLRKSDIFLTENAPTKNDPSCVKLRVDKVTGLLASDSCPAEAQEERSFLVPYNAAGKLFPQWDTNVIEWATAQMRENPKTGSGLSIFLSGSGGVLPLPLAPTEKCDIALTPGRMTKPTLTILSPGGGGTANYPSFKPNINYTVGSMIRTITYEIDGKLITTVTSAPLTPPIRVPKSIEKSGTHQLHITLTDQYYNTASDAVSFTFEQDSTGPSIRVTAPQDGSELAAGSPLIIQAESDDPGGVKYVEFYLDALLLTRKPIAPYTLTYPAKIEPGSHTVRAVATDIAGNTGEDEVMIIVK